MPRNGGRIIFQSRFPDFTGAYVNHCHLLQHEDWGMMQQVKVMPPILLDQANYVPAVTLASTMSYTDTKPSASTMYTYNIKLEGIPIPPPSELSPGPPPTPTP